MGAAAVDLLGDDGALTGTAAWDGSGRHRVAVAAAASSPAVLLAVLTGGQVPITTAPAAVGAAGPAALGCAEARLSLQDAVPALLRLGATLHLMPLALWVEGAPVVALARWPEAPQAGALLMAAGDLADGSGGACLLSADIPAAARVADARVDAGGQLHLTMLD